MRISKYRIEDNLIELRVKTSGRKCREWRRRFESNKTCEAFITRLNRVSALDESFGPRLMDGANYEDLIEEFNNPAAKKEGMNRPFSEELEYWKKHRYSKFSPGWKANIDGYIAEFKDLEPMKISQINAELFDQIDFQLDDEGNSRKTINLKIGWIKSILNFSVERRRLAYNPVAKYKFTKPPVPAIEFWEREEAISFLKWANNKYPRGNQLRMRFVVYLTALNAVLRAGELWGLLVGAVKHDRGIINVNVQFDVKSKEFRELKGKESRTAPLNDELSAEIEAYVEQMGLKPDDLLFSKANGDPMDHDVFREYFLADLAEWGGRAITFHALRHTGATLMLAAGVDLKTVQEILGHKDINTTMRYVHVLAESVKKAGKTFGLGTKRPTKAPPPEPPTPPQVDAGRKVRHLQLVV